MAKNRQTVVAGGNVDVQALFGEKATSRSKRKSGSLTAPRLRMLTHASSFALSVQEGDGEKDVAMIVAMEIQRMSAAEDEQTLTDGFWGLDKEASDRGEELKRMSLEDALSADSERLLSVSSMQKRWEEEERLRVEEDRVAATVREEHARMEYMETFYETQSSGGVLKYSWPARPGTLQYSKQDQTDNDADMDKYTGTAVYKEGYEILCSDFGNISTIHVNGLQRAQELSVGGEKADANQSKAIASMAMRPAGTRKQLTGTKNKGPSKDRSLPPLVPSSSPRSPSTPLTPTKIQQQEFSGDEWGVQSQKDPDLRDRSGGFPRENQSPRSRINLLELSSRYLGQGTVRPLAEGGGNGSKHNALYDGHPMYRWDQEKMLRAVFGMMDEDGQGRVGRAHISEMARNTDIQSILKYTVFWLLLKRRQWTFFYGIFEDNAETIGITEWLQAANGLAANEEVVMSRIRLDREHQEVAKVCSITCDWSETRFASENRSLLDKIDRAATALRLLAPGDLVWALYSNGCRWLPARVVTVNNFDGHCLCQGTVVVRYIMSMDDFKKAQSDTLSREFLPKASTRKQKKQNPKPFAVKPFLSERDVCAYVFDLVDKECTGVVEPSALVEKLTDPLMNNVVNTSSSLHRVVKGGANLLGLIIEMFPGDVESGNGVSKLEFVEFCSEVNDMNRYMYDNRSNHDGQTNEQLQQQQ